MCSIGNWHSRKVPTTTSCSQLPSLSLRSTEPVAMKGIFPFPSKHFYNMEVLLDLILFSMTDILCGCHGKQYKCITWISIHFLFEKFDIVPYAKIYVDNVIVKVMESIAAHSGFHPKNWNRCNRFNTTYHGVSTSHLAVIVLNLPSA